MSMRCIHQRSYTESCVECGRFLNEDVPPPLRMRTVILKCGNVVNASPQNKKKAYCKKHQRFERIVG